ncbi:hypothetical protein psyc5s11_50830 [Clostridium gelidum]|uniref:Glycosyltransferase 2-like domain-containing protein n=1 Tax=Clostridium gelidum TaxID=704125 RepID=A0ABM7TC88_9CLOT|nr:glycosyltransferase family 2 protein [Clostridium gelidum]BCZ49016.1 hypothetical protein psyc5s11_50830 [Clostridium gelidum]
MKFSIVIACYNEEKSLETLIERILPLTLKYNIEFILVENGSTDNSRDVFKSLEAIDHKSIEVIYVDKNRGYGYGLLQGLKSASGNYVGWIHADMQIAPKELCKFLSYAEKFGNDTRFFLKGKRENRSLVDRLFTAGQSIFNSILFMVPLYDVGAIPVIFERTLLHGIDIAPYDFSIELFFYNKAIKNRFVIKRERVTLIDRENGASSWNKGIKSKFMQSRVIFVDSIKIRLGIPVR